MKITDNFGVQEALDRVRKGPGFLKRSLGYTVHYLLILFALSPLFLIALLPLYSDIVPAYLLIILFAWVAGFVIQQFRLLDPLLERLSPKPQVREFRKKSVAVIGAGPGGLAALKECRAQGLEAVCFEQNNSIGGVYRYDEKLEGGVWESLILTTSPWVTAFSDFQPSSSSSRHHSHRDYVTYLNSYVDHFKLRDGILLNHEVKRVAQTANGLWALSVLDEQSGEEIEREFDHVVVCSGLNQCPKDYVIPGIKAFEGDVFHASQYKSPEQFKGKKVLVVGLGESGADISTELANCSGDTHLSINHGVFVVPRINPLNGVANDYDTNRMRYSTTVAVRDWFMMFRRRVCFWMGEHTEVSAVRAQLLSYSGAGPMSQKSVKQDEFIHAILAGNLKLQKQIERFEGKTVLFNDGTSDTYDCVVFTNGYQPDFPFIELPDDEDKIHPGTLYLNMFSPEFGDGLAFCGFARPAIGSIPPTAELQARYFSMIAAGKRTLPEKNAMIRLIQKDLSTKRKHFPALTQPNVVISWIPYMDKLAGLIGCRPNPWRLLMRPGLLWKVATGPTTGAIYRLHGEQSDPIGEKTVLFLPRMHKLVELLTMLGLNFWVWPYSLISSNIRTKSSNSFI